MLALEQESDVGYQNGSTSDLPEPQQSVDLPWSWLVPSSGCALGE